MKCFRPEKWPKYIHVAKPFLIWIFFAPPGSFSFNFWNIRLLDVMTIPRISMLGLGGAGPGAQPGGLGLFELSPAVWAAIAAVATSIHPGQTYMIQG